MRRLLFVNILLIIALLFSSCGDIFNEESEESTVAEPVSEASDESEASHEIIYTLPDIQIPEEPEYDPSEYSPPGTEGATKIIIKSDNYKRSVTEEDGLRGNKEITDVYIEDGITAIGVNAFRDCTALKTVRLPRTLKKFESNDKGAYCFAGCTALKTIYIPYGVTQIPVGTFDGCLFLKTVSLPEGLETISYDAFRDTAITEIKLPRALKFLGRSSLPFENIKILELPDNLTSVYYINSKVLFVRENSPTHNFLKQYTRTYPEDTLIIFKDGGPYVEVVEPEESSDIPELEYTRPEFKEYVEPEYDLSEYSPFGTEGATKIIVRVEDIGQTLFQARMFENIPNAADITDIYFEDGIVAIGGEFSYYCQKLKSVRLPNTLETLSPTDKGSAFFQCIFLEEIYIPGSLRVIPNDCFSLCVSLRNVWLGDGVRAINREAFYGCYALTELKLPDSITYIGRSALPLSMSADKPGIRFLDLPDNMTFWYIDCEAIFVNKDSKTYQFILDQQEVSKDTKIVFK